MSKFLVETNYTCAFKIVHELDKLDEKALSDVDNRTDGKVEIINVTINNRKTKRSDGKTGVKKSDLHDVKISHSDKNNNSKKLEAELSKKSLEKSVKYKTNLNEKRFQMPDNIGVSTLPGDAWRVGTALWYQNTPTHQLHMRNHS